MASLKFADSHNLAILLAEPLVAHVEFRSMNHGLKECYLSTALTVSPVVYQGIIKEFWMTAKMKRGDDRSVSIQAEVKGCKIIITEQTIRDALQIDDQSSYPTEIAVNEVQEVLIKMG